MTTEEKKVILMTQNLDEVTVKYFQNIIKNSWTWRRLTEEEKQRFVNLEAVNRIEGNKDVKEQWLFTVYAGFLAGLGYDGLRWREAEEEKEEPFF